MVVKTSWKALEPIPYIDERMLPSLRLGGSPQLHPHPESACGHVCTYEPRGMRLKQLSGSVLSFALGSRIELGWSGLSGKPQFYYSMEDFSCHDHVPYLSHHFTKVRTSSLLSLLHTQSVGAAQCSVDS